MVTEHGIQFVFMAMIIFSAQAFSRRAQRERQRSESRRLRVALAVSLPALRAIYEDNLEILADGKLKLLSGRSQISLLRTQFGRLTFLEPTEIEAVMTASVAAERVESGMEIAGHKIGAAAFKVPANDAARATLRSTLHDACDLLGAAQKLLETDGTAVAKIGSSPPSRAAESRQSRPKTIEIESFGTAHVRQPSIGMASRTTEQYPASV
jgi:hypothetical protein